MQSRIMYIENKSTGEARIGRVTFSRTGKSISYKGKRFSRIRGGGIRGNYFLDNRDPNSQDIPAALLEYVEYWISGCKKDGQDSHPCEPVQNIVIDEDVAEEYWRDIRGQKP